MARLSVPKPCSVAAQSRTATLRLPADGVCWSLTLTDGQGRAVRHHPAPMGWVTVLDVHGLPAGCYLLRGTGAAQRLVVE